MPQVPPYQSAALLELLRYLQQHGYRHTTITPLSHACVNARPDNAWAQDLAGILGWSRPFRRERVDDACFTLMQQAGMLSAVEGGWRSRLRVSSLGAQLYLHSAFPTEAQDAVFFGPDTYRYVQAIDAYLAQRQTKANAAPLRDAVDICCGAAPGAVAIASACPQARVWASDINALALQLSAVNAEAAGCGHINVLHSDLLQALPDQLDLVCANPPYLLDPQQRAYRHGGGELGTGLALAIIEQTMPRLRPGGSLLLYTGVAILAGQDPLWQAAQRLVDTQRYQLHYRELDPDVFGEELAHAAYVQAERIAAVVLTVTRY